MISVHNLQKVRDGRTVLEIDALEMTAGEIAAVTGPSGSGKSSLLSLFIGHSYPTSGHVQVAGKDPYGDRLALSRKLGVLFAEETLYATRRARGNLAFHARLRRLPPSRVDDVLGLVGLADQGNAKVADLSSGLRRRLAFGVAILHKPVLLLLEEPFARCDDATISLLSQLVKDHAATGGSALLLTATEAYLPFLCHTIYELDQGRIVTQRKPQEDSAETTLPFKIPVKLEGRVALVNPGDILYVFVEDGRSFLQTRKERLPTQYTLTELEQRLSRSGFFRAHRAYLVNLQYVTEVIPYTRSSFSLRLNDDGGSKIPLSRDAERELREILDF